MNEVKDSSNLVFKLVVTKPNGDLILLQACLKMDDLGTKEREISALCEACREFWFKLWYYCY